MWQKRSGFTGAFLLWKNDICDDIIVVAEDRERSGFMARALFLWKRPSFSDIIIAYADSVTKIKMSGYQW